MYRLGLENKYINTKDRGVRSKEAALRHFRANQAALRHFRANKAALRHFRNCSSISFLLFPSTMRHKISVINYYII